MEKNSSAGGGGGPVTKAGRWEEAQSEGGGGAGRAIIAMSAGVSQQKVQAQTSSRPAICDSFESCVVSIATMPYPLKMAEEWPRMPGAVKICFDAASLGD